MTKSQAQSIRLAAELDGAIFYTGRPCLHGHKGIRYTATKHCRDCERERLNIRRLNNSTLQHTDKTQAN